MVVSKERYCLLANVGKTTTLLDHLRSGHTKSCGCYSALVTSKAKKCMVGLKQEFMMFGIIWLRVVRSQE